MPKTCCKNVVISRCILLLLWFLFLLLLVVVIVAVVLAVVVVVVILVVVVVLFMLMCPLSGRTLLRNVSDFLKVWVLFCSFVLEFFYFCIVVMWVLENLNYRKKNASNDHKVCHAENMLCWGHSDKYISHRRFL